MAKRRAGRTAWSPWAGRHGADSPPDGAATATPVQPSGPGDSAELRRATSNSIRALQLIRAYRVRGHLEADLDPLGLDKRGPQPELDYRTYGFDEADLDRDIFINNLGRERATLRELIALLRAIYCGKIGVEYMHIQVLAERAWIQQKFERRQSRPVLSPAAKKAILRCLIRAETFERFLDRRFTGTKRFGIEGAESLMPALEAVLERGGELGIDEFVIGMPHRGRLNVLANFVGKPFAAIFSEFQGNATNPEHVHGSGDVKYHLGTSGDREIGNRIIHLSLAANPSHLEAVDPVVLGKVRAKQHQRGDRERGHVAGILMHGDAAFAGQGLVAEALELSELTGFCTGGTVHVIVNNQIGFTTAPAAARSSPYPSDVAKAVQAPIFHVNGDDPEAVVDAVRTAVEYRQEFKKDVVLDLFCYRRHGHNEGDEPAFTQPLMYRTIARHPTTRQLYARRLVDSGIVAEAEVEAMAAGFIAELETQFAAAQSYRPNKADWLEGAWAGLEPGSGDDGRAETGVAAEELRELGQGLVTVPDELSPQSQNRPSARRQARSARRGRGHRLGHRRGAGLCLAVRRGDPCPLVRSGQRARHLLAPARDPGRSGDRGALCADQPCPPRAGAVRDHRQPALRGRRRRLRIRLQLGRPVDARPMGGAVRRFRQRRPGHHRPVSRRRRSQVAAHERPRPVIAARL